jgi:D-psicose/D-tagatose/L-ribulose 3-epimerase
MKIGVNTWVWVSPLTTAELEWLAPHICQMGFDWIELAIEDCSLVDYQKAKQIIQDNGLGVSVCAALGPDRDLIHPDPVLRENGMAYLYGCIDAAYALGSHVLGGPFYSSVGRTWKQTPAEREQDMLLLISQLRLLSDYAAERDVVMGLEALNRFESSFMNLTDQILEVVERVDHPACQVMVDTFHMNIEERSLGEAIRKTGKRLVHVHTCENDRGAPGSGHVPWDDVAQALKDIDYQGACVIESFTAKVETIARAAAIWRPLAESQDSLARDGLAFLRQKMN